MVFKHSKKMSNWIIIDPRTVKYREVPLTALVM